ncbi:substrate-binding domain-containing protein [Geomesophilobacter sediminis]|uniref:Substrate-binding domain-containing protein n=1 Tax=Geomesophilobacter sediminis TaxID=2798584 RepID=A0A8J7M2K0_9BACT|nr:substrate-binding domain-containing protein [Geomesophilobacter sediminis]MBJ6727231.1 substrate-binding domain-containing protein [Geomesophilobacter sediminis]
MKRVATKLAVFFMVAAGTSLAFGEEITVGGGGAPIDGIFRPVKEPFEKATGISIKLNFSSATLAFKQLADGGLDASTAGVAYPDLLKAMDKEKLEVGAPSAYTATVLGSSNIFTIVNKDNPVGKLSKDQIKGIFTGKIGNWKELGGNDAPIIVVLSKINPATNAAYKKLALSDEPYLADVLDAGRFEDLRDKVASTPEAIGFGPASMLDQSVKTVQTPEFSRPVILVTKGQPTPKLQKLIDFIHGDGKKYLKL